MLHSISLKKIIVFSVIASTIALLGFSVNNKPKKGLGIDAEIGRLFFYDERISINKTKSCASCHNPQLAFTDGLKTPLGALGDTVIRNTPTIINLDENTIFNWADDRIASLQQQSNIPLFGRHPIEMGNDSFNTSSLDFAFADPLYQRLFAQKKIDKLDWTMVKDFIAAYVKTFNFHNSKYDKFLKGKQQLTADELAGKKLFFSDKLNCKKCHSGNDFDEPEFTRMNPYQNIGLYCVGKDSLYGNNDNGLYNVNGDKDDIGKFKIPSLRNIAITAPYFHDGSATTLTDVVEHYARGGRKIEHGKNAGDGKLHPLKNQFISGFKITDKEKKQLISFLKSLTDTAYSRKEFYKNPFKK